MGVYCASLQSHGVEETAIPHNLVGKMEGAVNEDPHLYGRSSGAVKLSCTPAQQTGMLEVFSSVRGGGRGAVMLGGTAVGNSKPHEWKLPHMVHHNMNSCTILTYIHADRPVWNMYILYTNTQGTITSVDAQSLCPSGPGSLQRPSKCPSLPW